MGADDAGAPTLPTDPAVSDRTPKREQGRASPASTVDHGPTRAASAPSPSRSRPAITAAIPTAHAGSRWTTTVFRISRPSPDRP